MDERIAVRSFSDGTRIRPDNLRIKAAETADQTRRTTSLNPGMDKSGIATFLSILYGREKLPDPTILDTISVNALGRYSDEMNRARAANPNGPPVLYLTHLYRVMLSKIKEQCEIPSAK